MTPASLARDFHGIGLCATGVPAVIHALEDRLGLLPAHNGDVHPIDFEFVSAATPETHSVVRPESTGRSFYEPLAGEATYFPADDILYIDHGPRIRVICQPARGKCRISMLAPESEQLWLATHPTFTIPWIEMLKRRGKFNLHAAAVGRNGFCILLPGTTGSGKSTLTVALLREGFDFMGDDTVFLEQHSHRTILAFPENMDVTEATLSFFPELDFLRLKTLKPGWPKHQVRPTDLFQSRIAWSAEAAAIVFPQIADQEKSALTAMGADEAFLDLAPNVLMMEAESTKAQFNALAGLTGHLPCYRLSTGRDFGHIAHLLGELL